MISSKYLYPRRIVSPDGPCPLLILIDLDRLLRKIPLSRDKEQERIEFLELFSLDDVVL
jgi:hypothetical protein